MKKFTIGITTHNESATISEMLDRLAGIPPTDVDVLLFDDGSTDDTAGLISTHQISKQENFRAHLSDVNHGTPSVGRAFIGREALSEYVVLFDGDDIIDVPEFMRFIQLAPSGYDILLSSYQYRDRRIGLRGNGGLLQISSASISRVIAGIGGKAYRTELLRDYGSDTVRGRSDDVRFNLRILETGERKLWHVPDVCFYHIRESRKSAKAKSINWQEVKDRMARYTALSNRYALDASYMVSLRNQLTHVVRDDATLESGQRADLFNRIAVLFSEYADPADYIPAPLIRATEKVGLDPKDVFPAQMVPKPQPVRSALSRLARPVRRDPIHLLPLPLRWRMRRALATLRKRP
ncbi:MAG TPA: glycosyltransferase [Devosia sp.]|jgi:glycosyltransferase involved in cell wall biosynthesis|nr:glycosyltransferase [Devosia sp.]